MADTHICETCNEEFPTSRGLNIHTSRVHGNSNSSFEVAPETKERFDKLVMKARPSALINMPLRALGRTYHDPTIPFTSDEARDIDGSLQDLMAEMGTDTKSLAKIVPLMPYLEFLFIAGPILLDKIDKISTARSGLKPIAEIGVKPEPQVADGSHPTLTRKDVQPDA